MLDHSYYHKSIEKTLSFLIPKGKRVLFLGSYDGKQLSQLSPKKGIGIEPDKEVYSKAKKRYSKLKFINSEYSDYKPQEKFDYIVLSGALGKSDDLSGVLLNLQEAYIPSTRIIVYQHNHLWQWILDTAERLNLKRHEGVHNWLSIGDVKQYLKAAGFEVTRTFRRNLVPIYAWGLGPAINFFATILPFFDFLKLDQYVIARPDPSLYPPSPPKSLTIVITVRNERDNIEPIVKSIPQVCEVQEILFVEGHSTDGTLKEIKRVIKKHPEKNVHVIGQPGKGQGDAIRVGYKKAKGDIILLYEGDGTSDPEDLKYFYDALASGRFEFIEGSRFVYPLEAAAMPFVNKIGNIFFAKWFSFFLGQRSTDVLSGIKGTLKRDYDLLYKRWGFLGIEDPFGDFELLFGSARMGLKFGEIPMRYYPRTYGVPKTKAFKHGIYLLKMAARGYWLFRRN